MKLFACMCNQPQRLAEAIAPVRAALVVPGPVSRWGLGYVQGGEVLLMRTPRSSDGGVDLYDALAGIRSDCMIGQGVGTGAPSPEGDRRYAGTDNTPPFRFRRWMFAQVGAPRGFDDAWPKLIEQVPEYMRRNMKGRTPAELTFHILLARLQELGGSLDDPNLPAAMTRKAVAAAHAVIVDALGRAGDRPGNLAVSNGRSLVVARLDEPLYLRRLHVLGERGERDPGFRGVLVVSSGEAHPGDGFEEIPIDQAVLVHRDLRVDLQPLAA